MSFLLDTNVVSEFRRQVPEQGVVDFLATVDPSTVFMSVVTIMELHKGVAMLPEGRRRADLETWLALTLIPSFDDRILGIDQATAVMCGRLLGERRLESTIRRLMDFWLASTALRHDLTLVTRNERDFRDFGVVVLNPWRAAEGE